jgi:hypothetical protein
MDHAVAGHDVGLGHRRFVDCTAPSMTPVFTNSPGSGLCYHRTRRCSSGGTDGVGLDAGMTRLPDLRALDDWGRQVAAV